MRTVFKSAALLALAVAACDNTAPTEQQKPVAQFDAVRGTGNPAIDESLVVLNNDAVYCSTTGQFDSQSASVIALMTSVLRFTPSNSQNKQTALVQAITLQLEHADNHDEISTDCLNRLTNDVSTIRGLL